MKIEIMVECHKKENENIPEDLLDKIGVESEWRKGTIFVKKIAGFYPHHELGTFIELDNAITWRAKESYSEIENKINQLH